MMKFSSIGLVGRVYNDQTKKTALRLVRFLQERDIKVTMLEGLADFVNQKDLAAKGDEKFIGDTCDLVIVIGGDGTMLGAARAMVDHEVPVLGVNRGRLGFLTDIMPADLEQEVGEVLDGQYLTESRFLLDMTVVRDGAVIASGDALNDVVLHPGRHIRMIEFELYIDGQFVYSQSSDGLIVSTPTGSTAYALSGGGPLMYPSLDAIVLVPLNPHTLSSRPIVVSGDSQIKLLIGHQMSTSLNITCDGQASDLVKAGDEIHITKKPKRLTLIHPSDHNYYETCRMKLGWGRHLTKDKD
ncbi:MAG: NAD(+) kinase [Cellvibrionaceae bacterium]